ncbi:hypothetical protein TeGR_g6063, partial [Tetraparma gracilis]
PPPPPSRFSGCDPTDSSTNDEDGIAYDKIRSLVYDDEGLISGYEDSSIACPAGYHKAFEVGYDTPYSLAHSKAIYEVDANGECLSDPCTYNFNLQLRPDIKAGSPAQGFKEGNLFTVNHFVTPPMAALALNMNDEESIKERLSAFEDEFCERVGQIAIDFWSVGGLGPVKAVQWNNKRPVPTCEKTSSHPPFPQTPEGEERCVDITEGYQC